MNETSHRYSQRYDSILRFVMEAYEQLNGPNLFEEEKNLRSDDLINIKMGNIVCVCVCVCMCICEIVEDTSETME